MPVPSKNPTAQERARLEADVREGHVALLEADKPGLWVGLTIKGGLAKRYTMDLSRDEGLAWLVEAKKAARGGYWIPTVCSRCARPMMTPSICLKCPRSQR